MNYTSHGTSAEKKPQQCPLPHWRLPPAPPLALVLPNKQSTIVTSCLCSLSVPVKSYIWREFTDYKPSAGAKWQKAVALIKLGACVCVIGYSKLGFSLEYYCSITVCAGSTVE